MSLFLTAFGVGLAFFASPGAVTALLIRRGLRQGFFSALLLQLGALIGVTLWAVIALVGVALFVHNLPVRVLLGVVGALLLLLLAGQALRDAAWGKMAEAKPASGRSDFALGAAISLANPLPIAFWLSIGSSTLPATGATTGLDWLIFLGGFLCSALLWCIFMAGLIAWGRRFVTPLFFRIVNLICGLALAVFALKLLWSTLLLLKGL